LVEGEKILALRRDPIRG